MKYINASIKCSCEVRQVILGTSVQIWYHIVSGICFKRNHSAGLLRWSNLQTNEGQRHGAFHLVGLENCYTASTSTVWSSEHREDQRPCAWPFYNLVQTVSESLHYYLQVGLYDGHCLNLLRGDRVLIPVPLIVSWDSHTPWTSPARSKA